MHFIEHIAECIANFQSLLDLFDEEIGQPAIDEGGIVAFLKERVGSVKTPKKIHVAESLPRSAAEAEQRWAEMGVPTAAPPLFNYQWLAACQLVEFQGHSRVPHLLFLRDRERAEVYVLSSKRFDVQALTAQGRLDSGGYTVEVHAHPFDERIVFLVKYTGGSLERFLLPEGTPTT